MKSFWDESQDSYLGHKIQKRIELKLYRLFLIIIVILYHKYLPKTLNIIGEIKDKKRRHQMKKFC